MKWMLTFSRLLSLTVLVALSGPTEVRSQPSTPESLRARKLAARRYAGMAVSLPAAAMTNGLRVCVRETPSEVFGYWRVPPKLVDRIDADLLVHLRKSGLDKRIPYSAKLYVRQYAGFVRDGARFVYIHAILVEKTSPLLKQVQKAFPRSCGDVTSSWGIQFDTKTKKFLSFASR